MIVSLMNKKNISSITLPDKVRGKYSLPAGNGISIDIEGIEGKWVLKSNRKASVIDKNKNAVDECVLEDMSVNYIKLKKTKDVYFIFAEPSTDDRVELKKYLVNGDVTLNIGRNQDNQIVIKNDYVSGLHAQISCKNNMWFLRDEKSANGTYVNGFRVDQCNLKIGDVIYIMGVMIVIGYRMLAINNPDGNVSIGTPKLLDFIPQQIEPTEEFDFEDVEEKTFYRSPRFKRDIETEKFKIDSPPANQIGEEMPIMMAIGPSMTMGMASMASAIYGIANGNAMSAVTSGCMLLGTVMWPIITKKYEKKRRRKKEALRQEKYKQYLESVKQSFFDATEKQRQIYYENNVDLNICEQRIVNVSRNLWERSYGQNDFLRVRIGRGNLPLKADISYPERKFEIERDALEEELLNFCEAEHIVENVPVSVSLYENNITGITGSHADVLSFANGIIIQLATLYSYDEVKFVFIYDEKDENALHYVKWLPHVWSNDKKFRFIAKSQDDIKDVSAYLKNELESRKAMNDSDLDSVEPYYIIFALDKDLALRASVLNDIYEQKENLHFSVLAFFEQLKYLPKECSNIIDVEGNSGKVYNKDDITGKFLGFIPDISVREDLTKLSVILSNIKLDLGEGTFVLPKMITFLEMFGVGKIEHLNVLTRWKENDLTKTLEAQVGVDTIGDAFKLDLHEKYHGPHGLVAGMTGSGKSEFIMTYILSLAINYHPYEVAFVLIDYKGGGMAKAFENLPHTAGIITNLDGSEINRSLISIQSELRRRQAIFAKASKETGISNIDIYKYQKMYREGTVKEPLQHLFIISDEFAELKTQQPEFMTQLVSAARIGRSLGVHLILATQKPSGVVDDQIWSNAKFKACLKVQDRADSMDMLKRPEAAELQDTGRFYLQVGYNELFKMGQSAWSGAPYYPSDKADVQVDDSIEIVDNVGRVIKSAKVDKRKAIEKPKKQIDAITDYLAEIATQDNIKVRPLWLEPIPAKIFVDSLAEKYSYVKQDNIIDPIIGEYDDPMNQNQSLLTLPLTTQGNAVVYGMPGSGKTTFLTTMVYSLIENYSPDEVNIYILDFAAETLTAFKTAPQVGDVVLSHEQEKIVNLMKLLRGQIQTRKKLFADYGGDIVSYNRSAENKMPSIVVAINNYAAFSEMYEDYEGEMLNLTREGVKYGVYFVLTATGSNAVRFRMLQNINQMFVLQVTDDSDYAATLGKTNGLLPKKFKGRGLCKLDAIYEFQTAHAVDDANQFAAIKAYCKTLREKYGNRVARGIPVLPDKVNKEFIAPFIGSDADTLPVGVETNSLEISYFDFSANFVSFIQSQSGEYSGFSACLAEMISEKVPTVIVDPQSALGKVGNAELYSTKKECAEIVEKLFDTVLERNNAIKDAETAEAETPVYDRQTYILVSLPDIIQKLDEEQSEKLKLILEKGALSMGINVIIADSTKNVASYTYEKWYKSNSDQNSGIWVGSGMNDQYYIKVGKTTPEMSQELSEEFGFVVKNGKATMVKLLNNSEEE